MPALQAFSASTSPPAPACAIRTTRRVAAAGLPFHVMKGLRHIFRRSLATRETRRDVGDNLFPVLGMPQQT